MNNQENSFRLAQSASALGAGLLGFGIGAIWGFAISTAVLGLVLVVGAILRIAGMYVVQMKDHKKTGLVAHILWISAWVCLLALVAIFLYISIN